MRVLQWWQSGLGLLLWVGLFSSPALSATLDPAVVPKVSAATFEVVAAKPVNEPITYEKPLPMELIPYQERTDKYYSIGTAFAIGNNRFVTAGHVLQIGLGSLWGAPQLRDASGHVYSIDKVEKYSLQEDFVVFSLVDPPKVEPLPLNTKPALNDVVYAVGNALGTGVVIRDGLYTSDTPEDQDGRWKWMRFSAAASPGNSGGPLLDKDGKLIGIVLMKSANENLNYALPISKILDAPDGVASVDARVPYQLDIFDTKANGSFKTQFGLPLRLADFFDTLLKAQNAYADTQLKALLAKEPDKLFPNGNGSNRILYTPSPLRSEPALIVRDSAGQWSYAVRTGQRIPLDDNGYIVPGVAGHTLLIKLRKPDTVRAAQLYSNPEQLMDMLAKTGLLNRTIGSEKIRITSLGKPSEIGAYEDHWQRRWQILVWPMAFGNARVMVFALPVPDGYALLLRFTDADAEHDHLIDLKTLTDFTDVAYDGSFAQWQDYLKNSALLPDAFKSIKIEIEDGKRFSYQSDRLSLVFTPALQKIQSNSELTLGFSFFKEHGKVIWDVSDLRVRPDKDNADRINIKRRVRPSADLDDDWKSEWRKLEQRAHPYEGIAYSGDDETVLATVIGTAKSDPDVLYSLAYAAEGNQSAAAMKAKLDLLKASLKIVEP